MKKVKREMIFFSTWELYEIHIWVPLKFHWDTVMQLCLRIVYGCFCAITAQLSGCSRDCSGSQSLECLLLGPLQKTFAFFWSEIEQRLSRSLQITPIPGVHSPCLGLRAFSGPECPHLGSLQLGSSHRLLPWGSCFVSVSIGGYTPKLLVPPWAYSTLTVRVVFGCPQC